MVYICNIKMSANTIRHINKPNPNIDIDDFINQLLVSRKFDELAEKVADKAAKKIKGVDKPILRLERFSAGNNDSLPDFNEFPNKEVEKETIYDNTNIRNESPQLSKLVKIDSEAVMKKESMTQSENLRLKYKYLTRNAYEKKLYQDQPPQKPQQSEVHNYEKPVAPKQNKKPERKPEKKKPQQQEDLNTENHPKQDAMEVKASPSLYEETHSRYKIKKGADEPPRTGHDPHGEVIERKAENTNIKPHSIETGPRRIPENGRGFRNERPLFKSNSRGEASDKEVTEHESREKGHSSIDDDIKELEREEEDLKQEKEGSDNFEKSYRSDNPEKSYRSDNPEKSQRSDGSDNNEKPYRSDNNEKSYRSDNPEKSQRSDGSDNNEKPYRSDNNEKSYRSDNPEKSQRSDRSDNNEKPYRSDHNEKSYRSDNPEKSYRSDNYENSQLSEKSEKFARSKRFEKSEEGLMGPPLFRSRDRNEPNVEDNKVTSDDQGPAEEFEEIPVETTVNPEESTTKPALRKEGNKVYAFPEGTDYDEYHEQYAKVQKDKEKNEIMAEASQTNPVFIDVASGSEQYPINVVTEPANVVQEIKIDKEIEPTDPYLNIQSRRIRCPECSRFTAETEEKMLRHIRKIHRGENPFQCCMCDYSTYNKILFEEHVRIHQGIKPYKCSHCPYRSVSKKNTKKHEQIHRPDNPHKCDHCGFIARHLRALNHHLLTHGQNDDIKCLKCNETFASAQLLESHRKIRKRCPECDKLLCFKLFRNHRQEVHGVVKKKRKVVAKDTKFVCAICKWEGIHKPRILLHLIHHPNQEVDESIVDTQILRTLGIMGQTDAET